MRQRTRFFTMLAVSGGAALVYLTCDQNANQEPQQRQASDSESGTDGDVIDAVDDTGPAIDCPSDMVRVDGVFCAKPCPTDMILVEGSYCTKLEHLCTAGYEKVGGPWKEWPQGVPYNVEYCEKFVVGHAVCRGPEEPKRFCIDAYEYPNRVGELPMVMVKWVEADALCKLENERLCGDDEWTLACEGPERRPYPYGWQRDKTKCNIERKIPNPNDTKIYSKDPVVAADELRRVDGREPIGSRSECVSPYGVYDMTGNADEWARNVTGKDNPYVSVFKGGHMLGKVRNRCRPKTDHHDPYFYYFVEGFRCCADPRD